MFADAAVVTGGVAKREPDIRTASGFFLFVPPGLKRRGHKGGGLKLQRVEDRTASVVEIGARTCSARMRHRSVLGQEELADGFRRRQELQAMARELAKSRPLSCLLYVAQKSSLP